MEYIGFDIGGTKCAVVIGDGEGRILARREFPTVSPEIMIPRLFETAKELCKAPVAVGFSCGGPLNEETGVILCPPNLPGWENCRIVEMAEQAFGVPAAIRNDANACALAEWCYGAGKGSRNMIFLTFGTGLGAGLILDGKLYSGTNGNAGEVGHIRLEPEGPVGYGKSGSFEGFCSGGGLRQLAQRYAAEAIRNGEKPLYCPDMSALDSVDVKKVAEAARHGDATAQKVFRVSAQKLGMGLSVLIDLFNPEVIVIGSIFQRCEDLLRPGMEEVIRQEALPFSREVCRVAPAMLKEQIGDYAALAVAALAEKKGE